MRKAPISESALACRTLIVFAAMMFVWSILCLTKSYLDSNIRWLNSDAATSAFWLMAKIAVWILPAIGLIQLSKRDFKTEIFNFGEWRCWLAWGVAIGLLIAVTGIAPKLIRNQPILPDRIDYGVFNVLIIAPLFEEFVIRAALLGNLIPAMGFWRANVVASVCFLALHLPGWYMLGSLAEKFNQPVGGALSIFILGLLFGWATEKSKSFLGGSIAHGLNNFAA